MRFGQFEQLNCYDDRAEKRRGTENSGCETSARKLLNNPPKPGSIADRLYPFLQLENSKVP